MLLKDFSFKSKEIEEKEVLFGDNYAKSIIGNYPDFKGDRYLYEYQRIDEYTQKVIAEGFILKRSNYRDNLYLGDPEFQIIAIKYKKVEKETFGGFSLENLDLEKVFPKYILDSMLSKDYELITEFLYDIQENMQKQNLEEKEKIKISMWLRGIQTEAQKHNDSDVYSACNLIINNLDMMKRVYEVETRRLDKDRRIMARLEDFGYTEIKD